MVVFWFLLALALLAAALVLLRLDARQRGGTTPRETPPAVGAGSVGEGPLSDDDEVPPVAPPADSVEQPGGEHPDESGAPRLAPFQRTSGTAGPERETDLGPESQDESGTARAPEADADDPGEPANETDARDMPESPDVPEQAAEPTADSSPRLLDRVRGFLPARRQSGRPPEPVAAPPADPLADSPVVRWLEDRDFEPTPTPAPEFRHGDFAGGLSALGTVSHGMFRGRRAIMGVTGGRTVLAMRRDTASDVVLDLSRPDVDAEPGFHDAGEVASLEARTSDYGRLDLIDRDRLAGAVRDVPAGVRRVWAEGEWVAATLDGVDDPSTWDDVVMALHAAADVVAPFPPIGGRARALPVEIDPGAPGAASGPDADPTVGMDGEVGTGTHGQAGAVSDPHPAPGDPAGATIAEPVAEEPAADGPAADGPAADHSPERTGPRRAGHLRLVPDRTGARDLSDAPVVADRGDTDPEPGADPTVPAGSEPVDESGPAAGDSAAQEPAAQGPAAQELDPFAEIMEPTGPVPARGDVAADHLEPRPPLARPTRGAGHAYPEDASVPPLAAGVSTGGSGIKPLGSEDDEDEIRTEVERFDAARIDGGSDLDPGSGGRHAQPAPDETPVWLRPDVKPAPPRAGSGKHRRAEPDSGRERPGAEPDVEQTTRIQMPPDMRD
ncbi:hypothetical protein [Dietzia sp. PP-33]|jgi:hypothetical protein|uniref:hypothetical protein n=1 Tax=Dietzia sp. PP-33 TaxID=2957500 RepID=UPI0029ADD4CB|nr:hypothetical protein [Dietzia sp. PP-33]MDX2356220.1 hypothetical protein [Dietzia sp. PP-33]